MSIIPAVAPIKFVEEKAQCRWSGDKYSWVVLPLNMVLSLRANVGPHNICSEAVISEQ